MPFVLKEDNVLDKYNKIWNMVKNKLKIKLYWMLVYHKIKANYLGNKVPKENIYYTCIACITINFVMKMGIKLFSFLFILYGF